MAAPYYTLSFLILSFTFYIIGSIITILFDLSVIEILVCHSVQNMTIASHRVSSHHSDKILSWNRVPDEVFYASPIHVGMPEESLNELKLPCHVTSQLPWTYSCSFTPQQERLAPHTSYSLLLNISKMKIHQQICLA